MTGLWQWSRAVIQDACAEHSLSSMPFFNKRNEEVQFPISVHYPKHIIKWLFYKVSEWRLVVGCMFSCLPQNTGSNYALQGSDQLLRLFFLKTGKLKWEQPPHPHSRAVGKKPQGHIDKMNLTEDQIVPMITKWDAELKQKWEEIKSAVKKLWEPWKCSM